MRISNKKVFAFALAAIPPAVGMAYLPKENQSNLLASDDKTVPEIVPRQDDSQNIQEPHFEDPKVTLTSNENLKTTDHKNVYTDEEFKQEMKKGYSQSQAYYILNENITNEEYINSLQKSEYLPDERPKEPIKIESSKGDKVIETIHDYTVAVTTRCVRGTGWFLDYVIPEGNSYPTTWFIATNSHVVEWMKFRNNPYNQSLPSKRTDKCVLDYDFWIVKDTSINGVKTGKMEYISDVELFYVPTNFMGNRYYYSEEDGKYLEKPYAKDFAILRVNFDSEDEAKIMTDNFYYKYGPNGSKRNEKIKFLNTPKESTHRSYFVGGYPYKGKWNIWDFETNWSPQKSSASSIVNYRNSWSTWAVSFDSKVHELFGRFITLDGAESLTGGASGSLVVDENRNALGLLSGGVSSSEIGYVEPLKFHGAWTDFDWKNQTSKPIEKSILAPKYDLLQGSYGQTNSHLQQLKKYFPNQKTHLFSDLTLTIGK